MRAGAILACAAFLLSGLAGQAAAALTVERLEAGERGAGYYVEFAAVLDAPPGAVMAVLQDYAAYPALDPRILEARLVGEHDGRPLLFTRLRGCVGSFFCRDLERYEALDESPSRLLAVAVAGRGDLVRGQSETRVLPHGTGSRMSRIDYRTEFEPRFWMPRWLVRNAMRRTLEDGTRRMFGNVEARAREAAP